MLEGIAGIAPTLTTFWDVVVILSTREPEILIPLVASIAEKLKPVRKRVKLNVVVFTKGSVPSVDSFIALSHYQGRISAGFFAEDDSVSDIREREVFLCGYARIRAGGG
ncbi:hypothetical protein MPER_14875 [Moniliophthora perniciosa FA553]|nr:hypothetical protein MPER_14875 [Moniliophthora perniciosa FA553]